MLKKHCLAALLVAAMPAPSLADDADAHADFNLEVVVSPDRNAVQSIRYGWTFDPGFSEQMRDSWDDNNDKALDAAELRNASQSVYDTMKLYNFFLMVDVNGHEVALHRAGQLGATYRDGRLHVEFDAFPAQTLKLKDKIEIGLFDPTFSIDFQQPGDLKAENLPAHCASQVIHPNYDEVLARNPDALNDPETNDPQGIKTIRLFATRLEIQCKAAP